MKSSVRVLFLTRAELATEKSCATEVVCEDARRSEMLRAVGRKFQVIVTITSHLRSFFSNSG
jgi:hypothetical protein